MPIPFTCPHCQAQTSVDDRYAGQTGPCSHCGKPITIPSPVGANYAPTPAARGGNALVLIAIIAGGGLVMLMIIGILIALLLPAIQVARTAARRAQSMNNLKQINLALLNYESTYGTFPPAYIADADGKPMHSWRVLILPFMEQQALYDRYNFDEPWDGPNNSLFHNTVVPAYIDPASDGTGAFTSYVAVTGANTLFPGAEAVALKDVVDGLSNTISVVTTTDEDILWCEPRDLEYDLMSFQVNDPENPCISSDYPGGAPVGMADASVQFIQDDIDEASLKALIIRDDSAVAAPPE
jgi:type II secretory pathway pseudopilin PulG